MGEGLDEMVDGEALSVEGAGDDKVDSAPLTDAISLTGQEYGVFSVLISAAFDGAALMIWCSLGDVMWVCLG